MEVLTLFEQWAGHRLLSEKVTRPRERAHTAQFLFLLCLLQKESKFGRRTVSRAAWFVLLGSFLVVLVGAFTLCCWWAFFQDAASGSGTVFSWFNVRAAGIMSSSVPQLVCKFWVYPTGGGAVELSDGSLKLRYCTSPFS